ncbi:MAG: hypothetical protein K940chlam9_01164 [Chlamydiae bacterium]|nr:hypothetical protein [Chlamydiota bacterium]
MSSFVQFYCNENLTGHFLLKPSLQIGKGYQRVFSSVEQSGCQAVAEVIKRIGLFIILPLGAILAAVLIPFGLATKGIASLCSSKTTPPVTPNPNQTTPEEVAQILNEIQKKVDTVILEELTSEQVDELEASSHDPRLNSCSTRTPEEGDPQVQIFWNLRAQIASFQSYLRLFEVKEQEREVEDVEKGMLINVEDNGNCLFAAFAELSLINGSKIVSDPSSDAEPEHVDLSSSPDNSVDQQQAIQSSREEVVKWMGENVEDPDLQDKLKNSLAEDLLIKFDQLTSDQKEILGLLQLLTSSQLGEQKKQIKERLQTIKDELETLPRIGEGEEITFEYIKPLLPAYFEKMKQQGTFGGAAELYALSMLHEVTIQVYNRVDGEVADQPFETINGDKGWTKAPRKLVWENNHYKAYVGNSSSGSGSDSDNK